MNNNLEQLNKIIKEKRENRKERIKADIELYGREVLESEEMKSAYDQTHHLWSTVAEHTLRVTASSVLICYVLKKLNIKVNLPVVVIAALCHDLGMLDRGEKFSSDKEAIRDHAEESVKVARDIVEDMPELAEKIIETHMWPMGKSEAPNTVEGVVVSVADKYAAFKDLVKGSDANDTGLNNTMRKYKDKLKEAYYNKKQQLGEKLTAERGEKMKGNEYNDLWVILNNLPEEAKNAVPEKYMDFVRSSMVPDGDSAVSTEKPIEEQVLSSELRGLLACLTLTYWAKDKADRRDFAETLNKNELTYQGKPEEALTEEGYQDFLEEFDEWNEMFGPIPFWSKSRGWEPKECYEITPDEESAQKKAGNLFLKQVYVSPEVRSEILEEAKEWVLVADTDSEETLYWHDNDHSEWHSTKEIEDFYKDQVVIKDGHFAGAIVETDFTSSMGLSVYRNKEVGVLFTDGTSAGRVEEHYSHSSDEVSESDDTVYSLRRR